MQARHAVLLVSFFALAACDSSRNTAPGGSTAVDATASLAAGERFTCALTDAGAPYCWGDNLDGEHGDSTLNESLAPVPTAGGHHFVSLAAGNVSICAITSDGAPWCWGDDPTRPGVGSSFSYYPTPVSSSARLVSIAVGRKFACGADAGGRAYCWGENGRGQVGAGDSLPHPTPVPVAGGLTFTTISLGFWHACGLTSAGSAYCWGDNTYGELGTGDTISSTTPRAVATSLKFHALAGGSIHQCAVATTGQTLCWGANFAGQLGDGTTTRRLTPTPVLTTQSFATVRASRVNSIFGHTCGITSSGDVYCWGFNSIGQLGSATASTTDDCVPYRPPGVTGGTDSVLHACAHTPIKVNGVSSVIALDAGLDHTCALARTGQMWCWGDNEDGELGDGTGFNQSIPVTVLGGLRFP